jgi:hypothetical protein
VVIATAGCPDDEQQIVVLSDQAVTATVTPSEGATLEATTGHLIEIPPGAVAQEVEVTLTPLGFPADPEWVVWGGALLEPHGLGFEQPAQLTVPLSVPQEPGAEPLIAEGASVDDKFVELGTLPDLQRRGPSLRRTPGVYRGLLLLDRDRRLRAGDLSTRGRTDRHPGLLL